MIPRTSPRKRIYYQRPQGVPYWMEQDDKTPAASISIKRGKVQIKTLSGTVKSPFSNPSK